MPLRACLPNFCANGRIRECAMSELSRKPAFWILVAIALMSLFAPLLATHSPRRTNLEENLAAPSSNHLLGTDFLGRDIFSRLLYGGRQTLAVAIGATLF